MSRVALCAGEGTPQCFLLTPKLLSDLPFTENVNVLQIMNGPHIPVSDQHTAAGIFCQPICCHLL